MKRFYFFGLTFFMAFSAFSQTSIQPPSVYVEDIGPTDGDVAAYSFIINQTGDSANYVWERNVIELTEGWLTAVCDVNTCHFPSVEFAEFGLEADSAGTLDVHVYTNYVNPAGVSGAAIIEVTVTNLIDSEDTAQATYYFNQSLSAPEQISNALKIYPNPVVSEFFVEGSDQVQRLEIYSVSGKLVKEVQSFGQGSVNVDGLKTGNYIVRMWDDFNTQISTNVLTVQ